MASLDNPAPGLVVPPDAGGPAQHDPQVYLSEPTVCHALEQVGAKLKFPLPPGWPPTLNQPPLPVGGCFCLTDPALTCSKGQLDISNQD